MLLYTKNVNIPYKVWDCCALLFKGPEDFREIESCFPWGKLEENAKATIMQ